MKLFLSIALAWRPRGPRKIPPPNDAGVTMGHIHLNVKSAAVQKKFWDGSFRCHHVKEGRSHRSEGPQGVDPFS